MSVVDTEVLATDLDEGNDDFDSGFDSSLEPTTTPEETAEEPQVKEIPTDEPKYAKITEEEYLSIKAALAELNTVKSESKSQFDKAFGQLGGMKQRIEQMQATTPAGEPIVATLEDFAEMSEEYPDFADKQMKALNKVLSKLKGTGSTAAQVVDTTDRDAMFRQEIIDSTLEVVMPDWKTEVKSQAFTTWLTAQPADVKQLAESSSIGHAAKMLRLYESSKNEVAPVVKKEPTVRQKQLEAAVNPKGMGRGNPAKPTDDDDFDAGFNAER